MINYLRALRQVMHEAKLPRSKLDKLIYQRLRAVLISAYQHVPYYRELMKSIGYNPSKHYHGPEDLAKLPVTTKKILKQRSITDFVAENRDLSECLHDATAGSTGIPLTVYQTPYERAVHIAKFLRIFFIHGYSVHHKVMSISRPDRFEEERSIVQRFGILRRKAVNYLSHSLQEMADILVKYDPDVLYGNRAHYELIALELRRRGIRLNNMKMVVGTGEAVHDTTRRLCLDQYDTNPVETYGSIEMGIMAYETPARDGLHLYENLTYFEFLDKEGKPVLHGTPGRVVVTNLMGKCMPFIRYDQGDFAVFEYRDGITSKKERRLTQTIGRENEYALMPDGTVRPYFDFSKILVKFKDIMQFRIIQKTRNLFQIVIAADTPYFLSIHDDILTRLKKKFPPTVSFQITRVDEIAPEPTGKLTVFVKEVD